MFTPITDRIISIYLPSLVPHLPLIEGTPVVSHWSFLYGYRFAARRSFCTWFVAL